MADNIKSTSGPKGISGNDYPAILPALLVKELRQGLRTKAFIILMILVPVVMSFPFIMACFRDRNMLPLFSRIEVEDFFWIIAICSVLLVNPFRALWSVYQEKSTRSSDLLVLTQLSARRIVFQKWVSYALQTLLLLMIFFPFLIMRYFLGGVELLPDIIRLGFAFVFSLGLTAISLWFSGMPILYRVICALGLMGFCILAIAIVQDYHFFLDGRAVVMMVVVALALLWLSALFIILAARYFSPPSENLSAPLRKLLLWAAVPVAIVACCAQFLGEGNYSDICKITTLIVCLVYGVFGLIELVQPVAMTPVMITNRIKKKGLISRIFTPIFLPGWESAALFLLAGVLIFFYPFSSQANGIYEKWDFYLGSGMTTLASALFIVIILHKAFQKAKVHALLFFLVVVVILSVILSAAIDMYDEQRFFALFPIGSMASMTWRPTDVRKFAWIFVSLTWLLYILASYPFWKRYWTIATDPEQESNSSSHKKNSARIF